MKKTIWAGAIAGMFLVLGLGARGEHGAANASATCIWIEAEDFADKGAWKVETQFTHLMGSAYLIAPGVLKPVGATKATLDVPKGGRFALWVRCKDWEPEHHPGRFAVALDGRRLPDVLGASGRKGWTWEKAGEVELAAGA